MTQKRYLLRNENFGFTLYDKSRLKHRFLKKDDAENALRTLGIDQENREYWVVDLSKSPNEIIYSPIRVYFEITSKCNLRCKTCFNSSGKEKPEEMTTKEIVKTLDGLKNNNVFDVRFCGGEPTTRSDWYQIFEHAKKLGFAVSVNTNGVYDNPETIEKLASLNLEQITISIDGGQIFHDYIRGKGNYEKSVNTLNELHKRKANLRINTVLTKGSTKDLDEIIGLAATTVSEINFFYMRLTGRATGLLEEVVSPEELDEFEARIRPLKAGHPYINILHGSRVMLMNSIDKKNSELGLKIGGPDGFTRLNLLPDGSIWPGGYTPHLRPDFYLGNIKKQGYDLMDIWRNSPVLNEFREISLSLQKKCNECPEKNVMCPGGSMEMEFYREKNQEKKNPYCLH